MNQMDQLEIHHFSQNCIFVSPFCYRQLLNSPIVLPRSHSWLQIVSFLLWYAKAVCCSTLGVLMRNERKRQIAVYVYSISRNCHHILDFSAKLGNNVHVKMGKIFCFTWKLKWEFPIGNCRFFSNTSLVGWLKCKAILCQFLEILPIPIYIILWLNSQKMSCWVTTLVNIYKNVFEEHQKKQNKTNAVLRYDFIYNLFEPPISFAAYLILFYCIHLQHMP